MIHVLSLLAVVASSSPQSPGTEPRRLEIQLLYLDMTECTRCVGAGTQLDAALSLLAPVLKELGWEAHVKKIHVTSEEQARTLRFASSPTVRINGRDIQMDGRESVCGDCGKLCTSAGVTCREWRFGDAWFTSPPRALFVKAVLAAIDAPATGPGPEAAAAAPFEVPENLKKFFATRKAPAAPGGSCCASETPKAAEPSGCCASRPASEPEEDGCCAGGGSARTKESKTPKAECTLSAESRPARKQLIADLTRGVVERKDVENGVSLRFERKSGVVTRLAQVVDLEQECCASLTFRIAVEEGAVWLHVTGPPSAKALIEQYFAR